MAQYNFLELIQHTLTRVDDENVTALDETEEATQVATLCNELLNDITGFYPWPHLYVRGVLVAGLGDNDLRMPTTAMDIKWLRYNGKALKYLDPETFEALMDGRDTTLSNVDSNGAYNDTAPSYWTTYDDDYIQFDSYDTALSNLLATTLYSSVYVDKTVATDDLGFPDRFHPVILDGVTALAYRTLKRDLGMSQAYEGKFIRGLARLKRRAEKANQGESTYSGDYGRKGGSSLVASRRVIEA